MILHLHFPFKSFPEKERERERERERRESPDQRKREREERAQIAPLVRQSHRANERRDQRDRATRSSIERCDHRSSGAIDERARQTRTARRSTSGAIAIVDRAACQMIALHRQAARLTMAPLVARRSSHRSSLVACRTAIAPVVTRR